MFPFFVKSFLHISQLFWWLVYINLSCFLMWPRLGNLYFNVLNWRVFRFLGAWPYTMCFFVFPLFSKSFPHISQWDWWLPNCLQCMRKSLWEILPIGIGQEMYTKYSHSCNLSNICNFPWQIMTFNLGLCVWHEYSTNMIMTINWVW